MTESSCIDEVQMSKGDCGISAVNPGWPTGLNPIRLMAMVRSASTYKDSTTNVVAV